MQNEVPLAGGVSQPAFVVTEVVCVEAALIDKVDIQVREGSVDHGHFVRQRVSVSIESRQVDFDRVTGGELDVAEVQVGRLIGERHDEARCGRCELISDFDRHLEGTGSHRRDQLQLAIDDRGGNSWSFGVEQQLRILVHISRDRSDLDAVGEAASPLIDGAVGQQEEPPVVFAPQPAFLLRAAPVEAPVVLARFAVEAELIDQL